MDSGIPKSIWNNDDYDSDDSDATTPLHETPSEDEDDSDDEMSDIVMERPKVGDRVYCHFDPQNKNAWYWGRVEKKFWINRQLHYSIQYEDGDRDEEFSAAQGIATEAQYFGRGRSNDESSSRRRDSPIPNANENPRSTVVAKLDTSKSSSNGNSNLKRKYNDVNSSTTAERRASNCQIAKSSIPSAPTNVMIADWKQRNPCIGSQGQALKGGDHKQGKCKCCRCCRICQPPPWCQNPSGHKSTRPIKGEMPLKVPLSATHRASDVPQGHDSRNMRTKLRPTSGNEESGPSIPTLKPAATKTISHSSSSVVRAPANHSAPAATKTIAQSSPSVACAPAKKSASSKLPILILDEDLKLLDDYSRSVMEQYRSCWYSKSESTGKTVSCGFECVHCSGLPNCRKFCFGNADSLIKSFHQVAGHLLEKCPKCPTKTKIDLKFLQEHQPGPWARKTGVNRTKYLQRLWYRLQNVGTSKGLENALTSQVKDRKIPAAPRKRLPKPAATGKSNKKSILPPPPANTNSDNGSSQHKAKPSASPSSSGTVTHMVASVSASEEEDGSVGKDKNNLLFSGTPPSVGAESDLMRKGDNNSSEDSSPLVRGDTKREQSNEMASRREMIDYLLSMLGFGNLERGEQEAVSEAAKKLMKPNDLFTSRLLESIEFNNPNLRSNEEVADEFVKQLKALQEKFRKKNKKTAKSPPKKKASEDVHVSSDEDDSDDEVNNPSNMRGAKRPPQDQLYSTHPKKSKNDQPKKIQIEDN